MKMKPAKLGSLRPFFGNSPIPRPFEELLGFCNFKFRGPPYYGIRDQVQNQTEPIRYELIDEVEKVTMDLI